MEKIFENQADINALAEELKNGKVIVYPTETCYGLGCDATNQEAVDRIFAIKHRQKEKSVLVIMADIQMASQYVVWSKKIQELAGLYWPGPLTIVTHVKKRTELAAGVIAEDKTLAFRVTSHPFPAQLSRALKGPLVSTSANISSHGDPYDIEAIYSMFNKEKFQPDILIDGGVLPYRSPSTVIRVNGNSNISVLRQGEIIIKNCHEIL
jgi:L-threonylcarbamoyladenylate synthase